MKATDTIKRRTWFDKDMEMWAMQTLNQEDKQIGELEYSPSMTVAYSWLGGKLGFGDCYEAAVHELMSFDEKKKSRALLCHGMVTGQGKIKGVRYGHAWIELIGKNSTGLMDDTVVDTSNGRRIEVPAYFYYVIGKIDKVTKYSFTEAAQKMVEHRTYGPW